MPLHDIEDVARHILPGHKPCLVLAAFTPPTALDATDLQPFTLTERVVSQAIMLT